MALDVTFYQSANWNLGPGGVTGGAIDLGNEVGATLSAVFPEGVSDYIGQDARVRYQKIWVRNTSGVIISNVKIFLNNVKHPGQIQIALDGSTSTSTPTTLPSGATFVEPIGLANAVEVTASLGVVAEFHIWIKQSIPANLPSEVGASTTIGIIGEV